MSQQGLLRSCGIVLLVAAALTTAGCSSAGAPDPAGTATPTREEISSATFGADADPQRVTIPDSNGSFEHPRNWRLYPPIHCVAGTFSTLLVAVSNRYSDQKCRVRHHGTTTSIRPPRLRRLDPNTVAVEWINGARMVPCEAASSTQGGASPTGEACPDEALLADTPGVRITIDGRPGWWSVADATDRCRQQGGTQQIFAGILESDRQSIEIYACLTGPRIAAERHAVAAMFASTSLTNTD